MTISGLNHFSPHLHQGTARWLCRRAHTQTKQALCVTVYVQFSHMFRLDLWGSEPCTDTQPPTHREQRDGWGIHWSRQVPISNSTWFISTVSVNVASVHGQVNFGWKKSKSSLIDREEGSCVFYVWLPLHPGPCSGRLITKLRLWQALCETSYVTQDGFLDMRFILTSVDLGVKFILDWNETKKVLLWPLEGHISADHWTTGPSMNHILYVRVC